MAQIKRKRVKHPAPWALQKLPPKIANIFRVMDYEGQSIDFDSLSVKKRIIRAINREEVFDQAREALKMVKDWLDGERYADQDLPEICEKVTQAVAAMEATHE